MMPAEQNVFRQISMHWRSFSGFPRGLALLFAILLLAQCAHREAPPAKAPTGWYMACQDPLVYSPKGVKVPLAGGVPSPGLYYVVLSDGRTRFYVPPYNREARKQALQLREASLSEREKLGRSTQSAAAWVASTALRLALTGVGAVGQGGELIERAWSE